MLTLILMPDREDETQTVSSYQTNDLAKIRGIVKENPFNPWILMNNGVIVDKDRQVKLKQYMV